MWCRLLLAAVVLGVSPAWAQENKDKPTPADAAAKSPLEKAKENPDDVAALRAYLNSVIITVSRGMATDPESALKRLDELESVISELKPKTPAANAVIASMQSTASDLRSYIRVLKSPFAELAKQASEVAYILRNKPDEATEKLDAVKAELAKASGTDAGKQHEEVLAYIKRNVELLEKSLAAARKLTELIGKDAAPLAVEAWVNGTPLTDDDLKGKVVLLDFWAIWCGPCIATFPHLREWQEKYADKGLVIIGLTNYYEYDWNEADKRASKVAGTSHDAEQAMLVKFAEHHGLKHQFGIQTDNSTSEYYGVTGIPHVVVIDQQGKIRMMRVGSGEKNAKDIGDLLATLLDGKAASK
jgi:thiol-disulfide isomerase/thioredoxin